ncbi:polysaccharide pyruvyl transferase family protein [Polaribacter sargassicola]|uniref:polysaccharide pyruvyl transferase family protein n=1 Tax=Polaribacter sargassicola TaxID=2836891 RepID=UPI001F2E3FE9|nr:polysaccharide pyruvyl transferase family protein [Polaribacter sp. DS7-9]MCG1036601.1 polysaccharide pyruvyl transferase family protein [Polaribacter sp. DS7-9]
MKDSKQSSKENFGDVLTPYLIKKLSGFNPINFNPSSGYAYFIKHSMMVGSIISRSKKKTKVWGSGIIKKNEDIKGGVFLAVRGPRTYKRVLDLGFKSNKIFGDPALLLPMVYKNKINKKYKFGIIPHYVDYEVIYAIYQNNKSVKVIDLMINVDEVENIIDQINECHYIISSSLHGIIVADTYNIPNVWLKFSNKLSGDDVKFYDYLESVNRVVKNVNSIEEIIVKSDYSLFENTSENILEEMRKSLLSVYPYKVILKEKDFYANRK